MPDRIAQIVHQAPELRPETAVRAALARMLDAQVSAAPVVDDRGGLLGILSLKDCFRSALNAAYHERWTGTVAEHMSREPVSLDAGLDYTGAAEAFLEAPFRVYPVVENGRLLGMLSRSDLLAAFLKIS